MEILVGSLVLAATLIVAAWFAGRSLRRPQAGASSEAVTLLQNQIAGIAQQSAQHMETLRGSLNEAMLALRKEVAGALVEANRTVGDRLDNTAKVMGDVRQQLGQLDESSKRMVELGRDISSLQEILQPPKLRGSLGELMLSELLGQILPAEHYVLQHHFKGGEAVDAVIKLKSGMVPVDAKFPLESFRRIMSAGADEEKRTARKEFVKDVKGHIDAIAQKYIRADEGTFDFALMYIPAENVYYETIIKDEEVQADRAIFQYALQKRVIPVSPNSFYAYLQTILLGLKGMRVEERTLEIVGNVARLQKEFGSLSEAFRLVGQHLENSLKKYSEVEKRFNRVELRVGQMDGLVREIGGEQSPGPPDVPEESPNRALPNPPAS